MCWLFFYFIILRKCFINYRILYKTQLLYNDSIVRFHKTIRWLVVFYIAIYLDFQLKFAIIKSLNCLSFISFLTVAVHVVNLTINILLTIGGRYENVGD